MRLSKDSSSWRARSVLRRDFRHDPHAAPEVPKGRPSRRTKVRVRPDHHCKFVPATDKPQIVKVPIRGGTRLLERLTCSHPGCHKFNYGNVDHIMELRHSFQLDGVDRETFVCRCGTQLTVDHGEVPVCPRKLRKP